MQRTLTLLDGSGNTSIPGSLTVAGNLTINGTTTTINTATLNVSDNIIILNNDVTGAPTENAGIEVERGTSTNTSVRWNETSDRWEFTNNGSAYYNIPISTEYTNNPGTVTSVGLAAGTGISISGGPITTSGTITVTNSAPNVTTNLSTTHNATTVVVNSSDGTDATINGATTTTAGVVTNAAQEWAGSKTFRNGVTVKDGANTGTGTMQYNSTTKSIEFIFA